MNDDADVDELYPALVIALAVWIVPVVIILLARAFL